MRTDQVGTPNPAGKATKATSIAFSWRSRLPFARPKILQTLQMPFWHPQPRKQRHQGPSNRFLLAFQDAFLATPTPQANTRAPSIAFYSRLLFARPQTLQTLQTPFWHPQPCRQRHQGPLNSFLFAFKRAVCQDAFLAPPNPHAKTPRSHQ